MPFGGVGREASRNSRLTVPVSMYCQCQVSHSIQAGPQNCPATEGRRGGPPPAERLIFREAHICPAALPTHCASEQSLVAAMKGEIAGLDLGSSSRLENPFSNPGLPLRPERGRAGTKERGDPTTCHSWRSKAYRHDRPRPAVACHASCTVPRAKMVFIYRWVCH